jgi:hypothetical protein
MHVKTKITTLTLRQWDYLQQNVERDHSFRATEIRVCAEFELTPDLASVHVELPASDLVGLLYVLQGIEQNAQAEAILTDAEQIVGRVTGSAVDLFRCENHNPPHLYDCRAPYGYDRNGNVVALDQNGQSGDEAAQDDAELELLDEISEFPSRETPGATEL